MNKLIRTMIIINKVNPISQIIPSAPFYQSNHVIILLLISIILSNYRKIHSQTQKKSSADNINTAFLFIICIIGLIVHLAVVEPFEQDVL